jgi:hypothetical protein
VVGSGGWADVGAFCVAGEARWAMLEVPSGCEIARSDRDGSRAADAWRYQAPAALRFAVRASRLRSASRSCLRPAPRGLRRRAPTCG